MWGERMRRRRVYEQKERLSAIKFPPNNKANLQRSLFIVLKTMEKNWLLKKAHLCFCLPNAAIIRRLYFLKSPS